MALEIPVVIDIDKAFQDAAKKVPTASAPLQRSMTDLSESLELFKDQLSSSSVGTKEFETAAKMVQRLEEAIDLVNYKMAQFASNAGSVRQMSAQLQVIQQQFERMGSSQMFDDTGNISADARKLQTEYADVADKIDEVRRVLTQEYDARVKARQEAERQAQVAKEHAAALTMTANSISSLNTQLSAWRQELSTIDFKDAKQFEMAAINAERLAQSIANISSQVKILGTTYGSIDQLNAILQKYNQEYNALSKAERQGTRGKALVNAYRTVSKELEKEAMDLGKVLQEEERRSAIIRKNANQRQYENAILNTTVKSMSILQEKERILSQQLSRTTVGSAAYERLKKQLQDTRIELEQINKDLSITKEQTANIDVLLGRTESKLANLIKRSLYLVGIHSATRFIGNIREVTSEFEMQRVALGGIIQDTERAEQLFKQIKAAAIQSPFEIKDLVRFTKELSAYRIETENLFDVTMRLADISAGLGVDMSRLVLAYGQVRAASVLRGQELRQFTEAGIPLVELLADKFTELNGRMVSTADVFELISKRAVPFSMIEEIFNDMTDAGGMFYKMQEKQSETLKGQWMKLKDALSIMYDEMGNTEVVHNAMERLLADAMNLMRNWRLVAGAVKGTAYGFLALKAASLFMPNLTQSVKLAKQAQDAYNKSVAAAEMATKTGIKSFQKQATNYEKIGKLLDRASQSTTAFGRTWYQLGAWIKGGGWVGIAIAAVTALIGYLISARQEAQRLGKEIAQNIAKGDLQVDQSIRNFKRLVDAALSAAEGSAEQRDALKELQRTYDDVIPAQDLQIEKLREMKGDYDALTNAIREKIEMQIHEQNVNEITETYGTNLGNQRKNLEKYLKKQAGYTTEEATRIIEGINDAIKKGLLTTETDVYTAASRIEKIIEEQTGHLAFPNIGAYLQTASGYFSQPYYKKLLQTTQKYNQSLEEEETRFEALNNKMGRYAARMKEIREELKKAPEGFTLDQAGSFEFNQARWKQAVERYKEELIAAFGDTDISEAFSTADTIQFDKIIKKISAGEGTQSLKAFVEGIQKDYLKLAPQDATTRLVTEAAMRFSEAVGIPMSKVQGYLKQDETAMTDYAKSVQEFVEGQRERIQELEFAYSNFRVGVSNYVRPTPEDIANEKKELSFLEQLLEFVKEFLKESSKGSYQEDPWILIYKNRMKFMQDFRKGVEDLDNFMSHSQALAKQQTVMEGRGKALGFDVASLKGTREELLAWYDETIEKIQGEIAKLGGRSWEDLGVQAILAKDTKNRTLKAWQDLLADVFKERTDYDLSQQKKDIEDAISKLTEEIKRSETVRNFYQNILDLTGDEELAGSLSVSVYGGIGQDFKERMQEQLNEALKSLDADAVTEELSKAFADQDFDTILKNLDKFPEEWQKVLKQMSSDNEKYNADWLSDIIKTYQKTKSYEERISDVHNREAQKRSEITESDLLSDEQKQTLIDASTRKETQDVAEIEAEALKNTYEWTQAFKDMERVSTDTLNSLIALLDEYIEKYGSVEGVEALKAIVQAREDAQEQVVVRNAYSEAVAGLKRYIAAKTRANALEKEGKKNTQAYKEAQEEAREALEDTEKAVGAIGESFNTLSSIVSSVSDVLALDDLSDGKAVLDGIAAGLTLVGTALVFINAMFTLLESNPVVLALSAIIAGVAALATVLSNLKVAKANREIKRQQELIDNLEESYDKLSAAMDKTFGNDYIAAYTQQLDILAAKQEAYLKQAQLERDKGKKADKDKIREYEASAREAADGVLELRNDLQSTFAGSDLASAAESFADSWLSAYQEFGDTSVAIEERMTEMVQNIMKKAALSGIAQNILGGWYDSLADVQDWNAQTIAEKWKEAMALVDPMVQGMQTFANSMQAEGINLRQTAGQFTGIKRDFAGASEESINGLTVGVNTAAAYMSHIEATVATILSVLTGGEVSPVSAATGATPDPYKDTMLLYASSLPQMRTDLASIRELLSSVIKAKGSPASSYVSTNL